MIEVTLKFADARAAAVALAKIGEGEKLLALIDAGGELGTTGGDPAPTGAKRGRPPGGAKAAAEPGAAAGAAAPATDDEDPFGDVGKGGTPAATTVKTPAVIYAERLAAHVAKNAGHGPGEFMRDELTKVKDKLGVDAVRKVVQENGHAKLSEVPAEKYPAVLATIDQRLAA